MLCIALKCLVGKVGVPETVHIAECDAIEAISTVSVLSFHVRLKASCRLVVTAEGFDGRLVHAAQQLVSIQQAKCNSPETYIPSPGRPCPTFYQYFCKTQVPTQITSDRL